MDIAITVDGAMGNITEGSLRLFAFFKVMND
jgi:hypothetical protein